MNQSPNNPTQSEIDERLPFRFGSTTALVVVWLTCALCGFLVLIQYSATPAQTDIADEYWPEHAKSLRTLGGFDLVIFVHPFCPCTSASLQELERMLVHLPENVKTTVVFTAENLIWSRSKSRHWNSCQRIESLNLMVDTGGAERRAFGAKASGEVFLYGPNGRVLFHGGVTGTRGHEGSNVGSDAVLKLVQRSPCTTSRTPVYGCPLTGIEAELE